jgi:hypothetical protein
LSRGGRRDGSYCHGMDAGTAVTDGYGQERWYYIQDVAQGATEGRAGRLLYTGRRAGTVSSGVCGCWGQRVVAGINGG